MRIEQTLTDIGWRDRVASLFTGHLDTTVLERSIPDLLSSDLFREELEREMLRSDRTDTPLTLLLFDLHRLEGGRHHHLSDIQRLTDSICECTRRTDIRGWYRDSKGIRIALIMHNTSYAKAERILSCVRDRFEQNQDLTEASRLRVSCDIYAYPTDREKQSGQCEQLLLFDDESLVAAAGGEQVEARQPAQAVETSATAHESQNAPRSIEELIAPPLPRWKRFADIAISILVLVALLPIIIVVAFLVKVTSPGPVIYKQQRVGFLGEPFNLWKFRSMRVNANPSKHQEYLSTLITGSNETPMVKLDAGNPEITWIGRILRVTCLDELPQLVNVLAGDMSLIGPRPCLPYEAKEYLLWHHRRFDVTPGLTGLWQVSGKNKTTFRQMIRLDIYYARNRSIWLDAWILLKTLPAVISEIHNAIAPQKAAGHESAVVHGPQKA